MASFTVESTFAPRATIHAPSHSAALERYVEALENSGRSYPEESAISIRRGAGDWRNYVCVDGFFERD